MFNRLKVLQKETYQQFIIELIINISPRSPLVGIREEPVSTRGTKA